MADRSDLKTVDHGLFPQVVSFVRFDGDEKGVAVKKIYVKMREM